ncbi:MAG: sigma-54-dependent Fis family transcriptional regulator [Deltaproteobacteria bacterium]|nr:sigma-54-dependent Fis family transcriptional regulator [Deltaproteobacteria bacterium]
MLGAIDHKAFGVLVVDDEPENLEAFRFTFRKSFDLKTAGGGEEGLAALEGTDFAVIVSDQRMPGLAGLDFLKRAREVRPDTVNILLTAYTDLSVLIDAVNSGVVYRYVQKPWDSKELGLIIRQAIEKFAAARENARLREQLAQYTSYLEKSERQDINFGELVGDSPALRGVLDMVERVAPTGSTVLLRGETGTGKELLARAIHVNSPREEQPFVRVNCAALAPGVLESELFGHEKGSFTGAVARRVGRFELADRGTIFLDEIGDLPVEVQIKLLRVLQEREFERVGGSETIKVDVRVVSATNRDLEAMIRAGEFREDLFYRLNVFPIHVPPLRDRREDVPRLARHFVHKYAHVTGRRVRGLSDAALSKLYGYAWPGNVRELENLLERAMILCAGEVIDVDHLTFAPVAAPPRAETPRAESLPAALEEVERRELVAALEKSRGSKADAARALGINRSTLYYRLKKYGLE